jgi:hypothetical protein
MTRPTTWGKDLIIRATYTPTRAIVTPHRLASITLTQPDGTHTTLEVRQDTEGDITLHLPGLDGHLRINILDLAAGAAHALLDHIRALPSAPTLPQWSAHQPEEARQAARSPAEKTIDTLLHFISHQHDPHPPPT